MFEFIGGFAAGLMVAGSMALADQIRKRRARPQPEDVHPLDTAVIPLEVTLTDWGPEYTGEEDVLPRWRWCVYDEGHEFRRNALDEEDPDREHDLPGVDIPYFLGNAPTDDQAIEQANAWICDTYGQETIKRVTIIRQDLTEVFE